MYEEAKQLIDAGILILPAKGKSPRVKWDQYQKLRPSDQQNEQWFAQPIDLWAMTGSQSGIVVLDCDSIEADVWWHERIGQQMDATTQVLTHKGKHYWFSIGADVHCRSWSVHKEALSFDVRADGGGVMAPPSRHPDGGQYTWVHGLEKLQPCPPELLQQVNPGTEGLPNTDTNVRSMLTDLLANPPDEGGRNVWLTQVAGHYATMIRFEDAYTETIRTVNDSLAAPLPQEEWRKTAQSVWDTENRKDLPFATHTFEDETGYLVSNGKQLLTLCASKDDDGDTEYEPRPYTNFTIDVVGRIVAGDGEVRYRCWLRFSQPHLQDLEITIDPRWFASSQIMQAKLTPYGCSFFAPVAGDVRGRRSAGQRIASYVLSQDVPVVTEVDHLGVYRDIGYVTHDGILDTTGIKDGMSMGVVPAARLRQWAPYRYGIGQPAEAIRILQEVMTFHEPEVCALFGAWWVACVLKSSIIEITSLFPFFAIEAGSESGKTTGFFSLMMQLNGSIGGHGQYTTASLRDRVSAHRNGIVWVDDITDTFGVFEIVRQSTAEGSRTKKQMDNQSNETVRLVSPIVITGESLAELEQEKALQDRAIRIKIGSPIGRRSLHGDYPQWDDIVDLRTAHPELSEFAGDLVVRILGYEPWVTDQLRDLRIGLGRFSDKLAVMRLGARIMADLIDDPNVVTLVDAWAVREAQDYDPNSNHLTMRVLPAYLSQNSILQESAVGRPIVWMCDGRLAYYEPGLSAWWQEQRNITERDQALGVRSSMAEQRKRLEGVTTKRVSVLQGRARGQQDQLVRYQLLTARDTQIVMGRIDRGGSAPTDDTPSML